MKKLIIFILSFYYSMNLFAAQITANKIEYNRECERYSKDSLTEQKLFKINSYKKINQSAYNNYQTQLELKNNLEGPLKGQQRVSKFSENVLYGSGLLLSLTGTGVLLNAASTGARVAMVAGLGVKVTGMIAYLGPLFASFQAGDTNISEIDVDFTLSQLANAHEMIENDKRLINKNLEDVNLFQKILNRGTLDYLIIKNMYDSADAHSKLYALEASIAKSAYELLTHEYDCPLEL